MGLNFVGPLTCGYFSINNTVSIPYLWVPHPRIWRAMEHKHLRILVSVAGSEANPPQIQRDGHGMMTV